MIDEVFKRCLEGGGGRNVQLAYHGEDGSIPNDPMPQKDVL